MFDELRGYIRMRQAYITSPQHRLRASATTVLISSIPQKWCTVEALDGLYDVFPGGIRNIWVNRNYDELQDKVQQRDKLALALESAETSLIKKCWGANEQKIKKEKHRAGQKQSKEEKRLETAAKDQKAAQTAQNGGVSSGNPHQVKHTVAEATDGVNDSASVSDEVEANELQKKPTLAIPVIGAGLQQMTQGFDRLGKTITGGFRNVGKGVNNTIDTTNGFTTEPMTAHDAATIGGDGQPDQSSHQVDHRYQQSDGVAGATIVPRDKALPAEPATAETANSDWNRGRAAVRPEDDRQPLGDPSPTTAHDGTNEEPNSEPKPSTLQAIKKAVGLGGENKEPVEYPSAFEEELKFDSEDAVWKQYIEDKGRETMRLPIFGWQWMPSLPLMGEKVDRINYCRREVARLNVEIEDDQAHPERFPLMNSAFVQFNHQVAAHMACQSLSHHVPQQMAPRLVEIDPNDVIWENMSIPWWQSYGRTSFVVSVVCGMIVLWAVPVAFTASLSQIHLLAQQYTWLNWLDRAPGVIINIIQGVLPATLLALLMFLLPIILRFLVKFQGTQSGMLVELSVQKYYFCFLFVQLFLVVSIASAAATVLSYFSNISDIAGIPELFAQNIPKAANYFFSYMLLQALSTSAGALVQVGGLIGWFILAPLLDTTARDKFKRQTNLSEVQWGTFFPVYTNLACIGLIYSIISPLIMIFNIITFTLFWFAYRYNTLYVTKFTRDTGGLLYPNAINYTFTGIYVMEIALIGLFFITQDAQGKIACTGQAIGMIVITILTIAYQLLLNSAFSPLFRYMPITLEDDATRRDEEFARAMAKRQALDEDEDDRAYDSDELERRERQSQDEDREAQEYEMQRIKSDERRRKQRESLPELDPYEYQNPEITLDPDEEGMGFAFMRKTVTKTANATINKLPVSMPGRGMSQKQKFNWADRDNIRNRHSSHFGRYNDVSGPESGRRPTSDSFSTSSRHHHHHQTRAKSPPRKAMDMINTLNPLLGRPEDIEAQRAARNQLSDALFAGVHDDLEDLTPDQRDALVQKAFQHSALRARRPVIWIPRDELGVSDDEVRRMGAFSKHLWVSNVRQGLDAKGKCVYGGAPPDFSEVDLIPL